MTQQEVLQQTTTRWEQLKLEIKQAAPSLGIDDVGFTTADPFLYLKESWKSIVVKGMNQVLKNRILRNVFTRAWH